MLPMDKIELTAFRFLGGIGSCFTMFQSLIWFGLYITGIACNQFKCGATNTKRSFAYCFYLMYFYNESETNDRLNFINPHYFNIIMWVGITLSLINFIMSAVMLTAFLQWVNAILVKNISKVWTICIIFFSIIELAMCAVFIYDIIFIAGKDDSKCFNKNGVSFLEAERAPAPYLSQLKLNLLKLKKKIRKLKKNLLFLDVVVDEDNNPYHLENPFILKTDLNNHVKEIWHDMFNTDIMDEVQRKRHFLPFDKVMKRFIEKKQIDLDEVDTSLLKNFDSLTNIKWVKPVEDGDVAVGVKQYLDATLNLDSQSNEIEKIATILDEYLKMVNEPPRELIQADRVLDNVTKMYIENLYAETHNLNNKDLKNKFKNITKEITNSSIVESNNDEEELILFYLKQFFDGLFALEQIDDKWNQKLFQLFINNTKKMFEKNANLTIDNEQEVKNIKEYLRKKYDSDNMILNDKSKPMKFHTSIKTNTTKSSHLINDLCENCSYFILWPSIVCMLLSLKTGLVWIINIIVVSLVLYYEDKIEIRKKHRMSSIIKRE